MPSSSSSNTNISKGSGQSPPGLSPIPDLYKNRLRGVTGGVTPRYPSGLPDGFTTRSRPTGSWYGYSTMHNDSEESDEPAYTLEDIALKQIEELRRYVRYILLGNK